MTTSSLSPRYAAKQVPPASRSYLATLLHLVAILSLSNSYRLLFEPSPITDFMGAQVGGRWAYLTVLGLTVSWLTFAVALLKDAFPSVKLFDLLKQWLMIIIVPVEGIISFLYWGLVAIDPQLLIPADSKFQLPLSLDIGLHALPAFFLWSDFLLFSPPMSKQANPLLVSILATLGYTSWMEYTSSMNKRFPYPFLDHMPKHQRGVFYVFMIPILLSLYHGANGIHRVLRGSSHRDSEADVVEKVE